MAFAGNLGNGLTAVLLSQAILPAGKERRRPSIDAQIPGHSYIYLCTYSVTSQITTSAQSYAINHACGGVCSRWRSFHDVRWQETRQFLGIALSACYSTSSPPGFTPPRLHRPLLSSSSPATQGLQTAQCCVWRNWLDSAAEGEHLPAPAALEASWFSPPSRAAACGHS